MTVIVSDIAPTASCASTVDVNNPVSSTASRSDHEGLHLHFDATFGRIL